MEIVTLIQNPQNRQTHRPPHARRTQSLLRQRTHLPLLAELHRHPRRSGRRLTQLRRQRGPDLRRVFHGRGDGGDDLRAVYVPLAGEEYKGEGAGRV